MLVRWLRQYQADGIEGLQPRPKGRRPNMPRSRPPQSEPVNKVDCDKSQAELLEEQTYLRAEVAYLKKQRALRLAHEATQQKQHDLSQD